MLLNRPSRRKPPCDTLPPVDSTARNGDFVRRRYQKGSVYLNAAKTMWIGSFMLYVLDANGFEKKQRQQIPLCPVRDAEGRNVTYRQAKKLLQPKLDIANSSTLGAESKTL